MGFNRMQFLFLIVLQFCCLTKLCFGAGCPDPRYLTSRTHDDKSICAMVYKDATDDIDTSCGGASREVYNTERTSQLDNGWDNTISSLVVREGCTLTVYQHAGLDDHHDHEEMVGIHENLDHDHIHIDDWEDDISGYTCECLFEPVSCDPSDDWDKLTTCSNQLPIGSDPVICKITYTHGFTIGHSQSQGHDLSLDMSLGLAGELNEVFAKGEAEGSAGFHTGVQWSTSDEFQQMETTTIEVDYPVAPQTKAGVYQAYGKCGDNVIKTQDYEVREETTGEVLFRYNKGSGFTNK